MKVVYDRKEQPLYIEREIIVRFDPAALNVHQIDDLDFQGGNLRKFLDDAAAERIAQVLGDQAEKVDAFKIYTRLTSLDTLSVTRLGDTIRIDDHWATLVLQLPPGMKEQETCDSLTRQLFPLVRYAHLNLVGQTTGTGVPFGTPRDPDYSSQASLHPTTRYPDAHINVLNAWARQTTGKNFVRVGVMDTGIDYQHPDFYDGTTSVVTDGKDYGNGISPWTASIDHNGHGTSVAGIIGARRNNALGIAGIAGGEYSTSPVRDGVQLIDMQVGNYN